MIARDGLTSPVDQRTLSARTCAQTLDEHSITVAATISENLETQDIEPHRTVPQLRSNPWPCRG
jgi:hypothetical protein